MKRWYFPLMNAPISSSSFETDERTSFDRLKLQLLDAFYQLDVALEEWIHDGGGKAGGASTGCRLKELTAISFADKIATKAQIARFAKLSEELDFAIRLRNLLVHCKVSFGNVEGNPSIFLCPVSHSMRANGYFAVTDPTKIENAINKVTSSARTLDAWRGQRDAKSSSVRNANVGKLETN